jgi:hypothetical protein
VPHLPYLPRSFFTGDNAILLEFCECFRKLAMVADHNTMTQSTNQDRDISTRYRRKFGSLCYESCLLQPHIFFQLGPRGNIRNSIPTASRAVRKFNSPLSTYLNATRKYIADRQGKCNPESNCHHAPLSIWSTHPLLSYSWLDES